MCAGLGEHRPPLRARHRAQGGQENQGNQAQDGPGREQKWIRQVFQVGRYWKLLKSKTWDKHFIYWLSKVDVDCVSGRSSSDATVSVSSVSKVESLNDTEMTNMTNM